MALHWIVPTLILLGILVIYSSIVFDKNRREDEMDEDAVQSRKEITKYTMAIAVSLFIVAGVYAFGLKQNYTKLWANSPDDFYTIEL